VDVVQESVRGAGAWRCTWTWDMPRASRRDIPGRGRTACGAGAPLRLESSNPRDLLDGGSERNSQPSQAPAHGLSIHIFHRASYVSVATHERLALPEQARADLTVKHDEGSRSLL
jgi:hypothetical protein